MDFYKILMGGVGVGMSNFDRLFAEKHGGGGSIQEITGTLPLTINTDGTALIDYRIYGNTEQTGTPTPENPIMPSGCGEKTENIMDVYSSYGNKVVNYSGVTFDFSKEPQCITINGQSTSMYPQVQIWGKNGVLHFENGKTYTALIRTTNKPKNSYVYMLIQGRDAEGNWSTIVNIPSDMNGRSFSVSKDYVDFRSIFVCQNTDITYDNMKAYFMLTAGSTAPTSYIPYGYKLPILSNSTVTIIYLGEVQTTRRIKKLVLTGGENWQIYTFAPNTYRVSISNTPSIGNPAMCSHFVNSPIAQIASGKFTVESTWIYIRYADVADLADFKSYLAAQYAAGTPVTVWYVLAEPETGIVNEPLMKIGNYADTIDSTQTTVQIPTVAGTTVIDYNGAPKPEKVELTYKTVERAYTSSSDEI